MFGWAIPLQHAGLWAEQTVRKLIRPTGCKHRMETCWKDALCKCAYGRVGSDELCTGPHVPCEHSITCGPLMIAVITCGRKSHFHQAKFFHAPPPPPPHLTSLLSLSCFCLLFRFWTSLAFVSLHSSLSSHMLIFHPSPPSKTPPALTLHLSSPCGRLIPLSYSFFCPKDIFPSYTASPHPSLPFHLFISMSKSHPFIFLQMSRLCSARRTAGKRSRIQRNMASLSP